MLRPILADWRTHIAGLLSWAVPFFGSFPFFSPETGLIVPLLLFKSIMVVLGALTGVLLLVWVFRRIEPTLISGLVIGVYWLAINWILDIAVLIPMSGSTFDAWFTEIGLRYLTLPIIAVGMGWVANRRAQ